MPITASIEVLGYQTTGTRPTVEYKDDLYVVVFTANDDSHLALKLDRKEIVEKVAEMELAVPMYKGKLSLQNLVVIPKAASN